MILTKSVNKFYGNFHAVKDVDLKIAKGEIVGFLGLNGAGKTTLMRLMTTYLPVTSGEIQIAGCDVLKQSLEVRRKVGYLPETPPLYLNMRVQDYLKFAAQLRDVPRRQMKGAIERVVSDCQLHKVMDTPIQHLSKGFKQRIGIAQALIHNPPILILDEPTSGLDPVQIQHVRTIIRGINQERTVLLSTHILSEMEQLVDRILIIKEGSIVSDSSLEDLTREYTSLEKAFLTKVQS